MPIPKIASSRSASSSTFWVFCNPESRRAEGFCGAVGRLLRERPVLIPWIKVFKSNWQEHIPEVPPRFLRLESPGRNRVVEKTLVELGFVEREMVIGSSWVGRSERAYYAPTEPGEIPRLREWFLGWRFLLGRLESWSDAAGLSDRWLCPPADVLCMFDKEACQRVLEREQVPVAPLLGLPGSFDELWELMKATGRRRVFVKPCHGSAASAVVALEASPNDIQAFSTVELVRTEHGLRMYNRRRIGTWRGAKAVRELIDGVCGERCVAQVWVPKAGLHGKPFDVRIVVIGGKARQVMVRLGRGPMTNSQLLGGKGDVELLRLRMGESAWTAMLEMCERAMTRCFPKSLYAGLDVLVEPGFHRSRVLEVNAFGDLLPRQLHEGHDTYEWEVIEGMKRTISAAAVQERD